MHNRAARDGKYVPRPVVVNTFMRPVMVYT